MAEQQDPLDAFLDYYEKGLWNQALRIAIPYPTIGYDTLHSREKSFFYFINYADACVFKGALDFKQTFHVLEALCQQDKKLKILADSFLEIITAEYAFFAASLTSEEELLPFIESDPLKRFFYLMNQSSLSHQAELEACLESFPQLYQPLFKKKMVINQGWERLKQAKPLLINYLEGEKAFYRQPWHPFTYLIPLPGRLEKKEADVFAIFLEPIENMDYASFLEPYMGKECLFVFETLSHLFQLLQFPAIQALLTQPSHYLYILELYPHEQFSHQSLRWEVRKTLQSVWMAPKTYLQEAWEAIAQALIACLTQPKEQFLLDTPEGNVLYAAAKRALLAGEAARYGKDRAIALSIEQGLQNWFDPHKGGVPSHIDLGPLPKDELKAIIEYNLQKRVKKPFTPHNKLRLVHVVSQLVDGGHAPTKLLAVLCLLADRKWFDLFVISTERFCERLLSYPVISYGSPSSQIRGEKTLQGLQAANVLVWMDDSPTYEMSIQAVLNKLQAGSFDIVVFHGPDEIASLVASSTDIPFRILFDHGTLPPYPCFDLVILSTEEAYKQNHQAFREKGMESCVLPFSMDVRQGWQQMPFSRQELGLLEDSFVMTTISQHLDTRLTLGMCHAIGKILKRCPKAVYAPIGESTKQEQYKSIFDQYGVSEQVFFLGPRLHPSQYARSMHLYLNEFPFGSGLALLDAMAAGCPIVSMYDEHGPQQARYAATYFGLDRVIKTGKVEDYVELACRLIEDPVLYQEWSEHAIKQYEKRVDIQQYVKDFERIIEQFIAYKTKTSE